MNDAGSRAGERGPQAVRLLLPVWGQRYLRRFFEFSLPTMIAPGNIPALAAALPCTFVFLTSAQDAELIAEHPGYRHLQTICRTEIALIDDLITGDNHSTTITLAFERAVRAAGSITDTCFLFLISDYLVADGSFRHVLARIAAGASGVLAGNFQVTEEDAAPEFHAAFGSGDVALTLAPRALAAWAMRHLHPVTAANTVDFPLSHSLHSNRLFWRVDEDTLLGRFYLLHMIAIRPETQHFVIGSSCDYSFIPELCPSGNVVVLTDSDDYLVVEMQPRQHERAFLRIGPSDIASLAASLSEWTTARHRENARHTVLFHAAAPPPALPAVAREAERFIAAVERQLTARPQPHRDHPYWLGAIAAHRFAVARLRDARRDEAPGAEAGHDGPIGYSLATLIQKLRILAFGRPPDVRAWHPRWPDYRVIVAGLDGVLAQHGNDGTRGKPEGTLAVIGHAPELLRPVIARFRRNVRFFQINRFLDLRRSRYTPLMGQFASVLLLLDESELRDIGSIIARVLPLLLPDGVVLLVAVNGRTDRMQPGFATDFALHGAQLFGPRCRIEDPRFVRAGWLRVAVLRALRRLDVLVRRYPLHAVLLALPVGLLMLAGYAANRLTRNSTTLPDETMISSVSLVLRPAREWARVPPFGHDPESWWSTRARRLPSGCDRE
jgi:hypothetical protein